jgi:hypothetical protein
VDTENTKNREDTEEESGEKRGRKIDPRRQAEKDKTIHRRDAEGAEKIKDRTGGAELQGLKPGHSAPLLSRLKPRPTNL